VVEGGRAQRVWLVGALAALARVLAFVGLFLLCLLLLQLAFADQLATLRVADPLLVDTGMMLVLALLVGALLLYVFDRRSPGALGFAWTSRTLHEILYGLIIGVGAIAVAALLLLAIGALRYAHEPGNPALWLRIVAVHFVLLAIAAAAEEALFRGYPFQALVRGIGAPAATILASIGFALAHRANPHVGPFALLNIALAGVLLSAAYLRTRSLWFATAVHLGWNWGMASLFDLPVSGLETFQTPLYEPVARGPTWLDGGAFGPEGGIIGSCAFLLAFFAVLRWPGITEAPEMRLRRPIVDQTPVPGT
jgi:membrane protease YdiL (CAAX protease family)